MFSEGHIVRRNTMSRRFPHDALDALWSLPPSHDEAFDPARLDPSLSEPVRRYLEHAIAPGTPLASAVRLRMQGEFRMKKWYPFTAEQVIRREGEMLWSARIRMHGLPITGFDSVIGGRGAMQWKLLGFLPLVTASGPQITRSAIGRVQGESVWLPSLLCEQGVSWTSPDSSHACARFSLLWEETELSLEVAGSGRLLSIRYPRWGNPETGEFHYAPFGGLAEEEGTFGGYTIPTRLRIGWNFGTPHFDEEGEFFRVTIEDAQYR